MRLTALVLLILTFTCGCKNPLSDSTQAESGFAPGLPNDPSDPAVNPPARVAVNSPAASVTAGTALGPLQARLQDRNGTNLTLNGVDISVAFATNPASGTLGGTLTQPTVNGVATFSDLNVEKAGTGYSLAFSSTGLTAANTTAFDVTAANPSPAQSVVSAGTSALPADGVTSTALSATLKDAFGNSVSGQALTFAVSGTGNTIIQPTGNTDAAGVAAGSVRSTGPEVKTVSIATPAGLSGVTTNLTFTALTPVSQTWNLNSGTSGLYTVSSASTLGYGTSSLAHTSLSTDSNNDATYGFGAATGVSNVVWSPGSSAMQLNAAGMTAGTGSFESRVFSAGSAINWTALTWNVRLPAGRALPDNKGSESDYAADNANMANNVLLLHMDEAAWTGTAGEVVDSSGSNHPASRVGSPTTTASGKFNRAGSFTSNGQYLTIPHSADFDTTSGFTFEAWLYPTTVDTAPRGIISKRVNSGTTTDYGFAIFSYNIAGRVAVDINSDTTRWNTSYQLVADTWQHIAVVFDGTQTAGSNMRLRLYVNGVATGNSNIGATSIQSTPGAPVHIGSLNGNNATTFLGRMDEVAVFDRALTSTEVASHFRRGRHRVKLQARACVSASCSGVPYVGPDGTASTYFDEVAVPGSSAQTTATLPASAFNGKQFFQYKATLESNSSASTNGLRSVTVAPNIYDTGLPTVVNNTGVAYRKLDSFNAVTGGTGEVRYQLSNGTSWYYWNGTNWVTPTLSTHTNTKQDVIDHIGAFPADAGIGTLSFKAVFSSGTYGTAPASLSSVSVTGGN